MRQLEEQEQIALFQWCGYVQNQYPELSLLFHIPNGGKRSVSEAARFKRAGVKAGVPDLFLPVARQGYHGLFIELKAGKNKPSEHQKKWIEALREQGYMCVVAYGMKESVEVLEKYLLQER